MSVPVVVGAYPQPFTGTTTSVVAVGVARDRSPLRSRRQVHGTVAAKAPARNYIVDQHPFRSPTTCGSRRFRSGFQLELGSRAARRLAADPTAFRYRYGDAE